MKVVHWNLGSRMWRNKKEEIELLLEEFKPDLCFVTEANLWKNTEAHEMEIFDHKLILPHTMETMDHARIVLIAKHELELTVLHQYMDGKTASIWVKTGRTKNNSLVLGGLYREHNQLGTGDRAASREVQQRELEIRWLNMVNNWKLAGQGTNCFVFVYLNLDYGKWLNPNTHQEEMVNIVQNQLAKTGYT